MAYGKFTFAFSSKDIVRDHGLVFPNGEGSVIYYGFVHNNELRPYEHRYYRGYLLSGDTELRILDSSKVYFFYKYSKKQKKMIYYTRYNKMVTVGSVVYLI